MRCQMAMTLVPSLLLAIRGSTAVAPAAEMLVGVVQVVPPSVLDAVWMMSWAPSY